MKRMLIALAAAWTLFLCGCQADENKRVSDYKDDISKAQEIAVISSDTSEVIGTITDAKDIKEFVLALKPESWKLKSLPDEEAEIGSFRLAQTETIKLGQADTDGTLQEIAAITLYEGDYIGFEIGGLDMTFEVSGETADYLSGYFE